MAEAVCRPANLSGVIELIFEVTKPKSVLIENVIKVADCLVVLNPPCIDYFELPVFD